MHHERLAWSAPRFRKLRDPSPSGSQVWLRALNACAQRSRHARALLTAIVSLWILACTNPSPKPEASIQFWHTFNSAEGAALHRFLLKKSSPRVDTTILPFAQAALRFREGKELRSCPDLLRIDSTRIPGLAGEGAIVPVPPPIWQARTWFPEAEELVVVGGLAYGIPQSLDGLALIRHAGDEGTWPPDSLEALERYAMHDKNAGPGLGLLVDGYWLVAFLRNFSAALPNASGEPPGNSEQAVAALDYYASLFSRGIAMKLLQERAPARAMIRAFRTGQLRVVYSGPWDLVELSGGDMDRLEVAPFPGRHAPRGGQVLAVPSCAQKPALAWQLALDLSAPALQAAWARELGSIPVTAEGLADSGALAKAFYGAVQVATLLPRHAHTPELFDDLTPAVEAVVGGDASAKEALDGVARAWHRLYGLPENDAIPRADAGSEDILDAP